MFLPPSVNVQWEDCSSSWTAHTVQRAEQFAAQRERHERVFGADTFQRLLGFYQTVAKLFAGGNLGGVRVLAHKRL